MLNFDGKYQEYLDFFNTRLSNFLAYYNKDCPKLLSDAMSYAVIDGGKRVRPILCMATAEILNIPREQVIYYALALEFIHSYSLVHDDLPAMDNDDFRRGKYSTHKKFGEAYGILAGDGLLNLSMETCLMKKPLTEKDADAMRMLFGYSGAKGMIAGQVLDLQNEKEAVTSVESLYAVYENKTAKLISASVLIPSLLADKQYYDALKEFSYNLGILFQITDDLLDVEGDISVIGKTPHKDEKSDKLTSIKTFGLKGAKLKAKSLYDGCKKILSDIPDSDFLQEFTDKIYYRKS